MNAEPGPAVDKPEPTTPGTSPRDASSEVPVEPRPSEDPASEDHPEAASESPPSLHDRLNHDALAREGLLAFLTTVVVGGLLFWGANHIEDGREQRQRELADQQFERAEVLENTRFVRQAAMDPTVIVKPFQNINLREAPLSGLPLGCPEGVEPRDTQNGCTDLRGADLTFADLSGADLSGANLSEADLSDADLTFTDLPGANLASADLSDANLIDANLSEADLTRADLTSAQLAGADLSEANLAWADLSGADLASKGLIAALSIGTGSAEAKNRLDLTGADLFAICYDETTQWPEGYPKKPPVCPSPVTTTAPRRS